MAKILFDPSQPKIAVWAIFMAGMMNPILFVLMGVMRLPGLLTALNIAGLNVRCLWSFLCNYETELTSWYLVSAIRRRFRTGPRKQEVGQ